VSELPIKTVLIDARNFEQHAFTVIQAIKKTMFTGIDVETQDSNRHAGLTALCGYKEDGTKSKTAKTVFDMKRTVMTGFSLYPEGHEFAYYVNLNHADIENRLSWEKAKLFLDAKPDNAHWIAHNAPYELTAYKNCYDVRLRDIICTMQMAVSAFGPDEYDLSKFMAAGQGGIAALKNSLLQECMKWDISKKGMPPALEEVVGKIIAKESKAEHSYIGFVKNVAYGYGLKGLVKNFFNYQMTTYEEVLNGKAHMGLLTGEETAAYGAEDAYWAVRLFRHLMDFMAKTNPAVMTTFFEQENPMIHVFSNIWDEGMRVDTDAIFDRRDEERANMAQILLKLKALVKAKLPFKDEPHAGLMDEKWYKSGYQKYRDQIVQWANSADWVVKTDADEESDDHPLQAEAAIFAQCAQVRGPVSNAWSIETDKPEPTGPNLSHYMPIRVIMYDLLGEKVIRALGKVQSDGEARGKMLDRLEDDVSKAIIKGLNEISGVEQRMKLYLTPYTQLMDPETGCLYPLVSSMLATRRMGASVPNPMQLAKRGESTYVRGFFKADNDDHVIVSCDWSGVELVEIGEFSGDPEFIKAFGQIPHEDLHGGAAADILSVDVPGLTEKSFKALKDFTSADDYRDHFGQEMTNYNRLFTNLKGQELKIMDAYKYWRTEVGKGANFNYWYSGFLGTIGDRMGWDMDKTGDATKRYRERFSVAEDWRVGVIEQGKRLGYIELPDHHRRVRFEATEMWAEYFGSKFKLPYDATDELALRYNAVWDYIIRKIQGRANNQLVNAFIQGSCATLAKRSIIKINRLARERGWTSREFRFMMPIHDELLFSVHRSIVVEAIKLIRDTMIDHPDMFKLCKLDASPSVGLTFEPYNAKKGVLLGQVELFELPAAVGVGNVNGRATDEETRGVVDYLFEQRKLAA
jgi:DNA polymerase I-like protein with 3'-5' exonuclease and polymerase domains